jgi:hypothetical protein
MEIKMNHIHIFDDGMLRVVVVTCDMLVFNTGTLS